MQNQQDDIYESSLEPKKPSITKRISKAFSSSYIVNAVKENCDFSQSYAKSHVDSFIQKLHGFFPEFLKKRLSFANKCENGIICRYIDVFYNRMLNLPLRTLGIFLFTYLAIATALTLYLNNYEYSSIYSMAIPLPVFIILMFPKKSIGACIASSKLLSFFHIESVKPQSSENIYSKGYSTAILLGVLFGVLGGLSQTPINILLYIISTILSLMLFNNPEASLLFTVLILPFMESEIILFFELITCLSFIIKFMRAKRHIKAELSDFFIFTLIIIVAFSGFSNSSGIQTYDMVVKHMSGFCFYFLVKNIIRSSLLANRCISIFLCSSAIISLLNLSYALLENTSYGVLLRAFTDASPGALSFFSTPLSLGIYLACAIPLTFSMLLHTKKLQYLFITLVNFACIYISCPIYFLYATVFAILLVLCFHSKIWLLIIPMFKLICDSIINLLSLLPDLRIDLSQANNLKTSGYDSVLEMTKAHLPFGTGTGTKSFDMIFSNYASTSATAALDEVPMYLRIVLMLGIIGAIMCAVTFIQLLGKNYSYIISDEHKDSGILGVAVGTFVSSIVLIAGCFMVYPFNDTRTLLLFWFIMTFGISCSQSSRNDYIPYQGITLYQNSYQQD